MRNLSGSLVELLRAPERAEPYSWDVAEEAIGSRLPSDYKELIDRIGPVTVDDWLSLFGPDPEKPVSDIARLVEERERAWDEFREFIELPERFFGEGQRLLAFAAVEANYFFWNSRKGVAPDDWGVLIVDADLDGWYDFDLSATECLHGIFAGNIQLRPFVGKFDSTEHQIDPFP